MSFAKAIADGVVAGAVPGRATAQSRSDRRALKRELKIPVSILDYAPAGTTEWSAAFNAGFVDVGPNSDRRLYVPAGSYTLSGQLVMDYPVDLFGDTMSTTVLLATHLETLLTITGKYGAGPRVRDMTLGFDTGGGVSAAHIVATSYQNPGNPADQYSPDFLLLSGLNITGYNGSRAGYNLRLDGSQRANDAGGTIPIGLRNVTMSNIQAFNATFRGLDLLHVRAGIYTGVNIFGGAGIGGAATQGASAGGLKSFNNIFVGCTMNGTFAISDSDATKLYGVTGAVSLGSGVVNHVNL